MIISHSKFLTASLAALTLMAAQWAVASTSDMSAEAIAERIQAVGSVHLAGAQAAVTEPTGPLTGDQVYAKFCTACHATGALNAPKFGDKAAWGPRVAQGKETLYSHALNGLNQMPAKGTCMACSEDEIKESVDHMLSAL